MCGVAVSACGSDDEAGRTEPSTETEVPSSSTPSPTSVTNAPAVVEIAGTYEGVTTYPACGNETFEHLDVTWYPLVQEGLDPVTDDLQGRADDVLAVEREASPVFEVHGLLRVVPPGPGDAIGTLAVWADGVARWVSDSGDLDVWMIDDPITYNWAC